jgi:hypothetical protein
METAAERRGKALTSTAKGQAAEKKGDLTSARRSYQAALDLDYGNGDAAAGLLRVNRRPSDSDRLWLPAQRLHDEGYDDAARAQIVSVLRSHPGLVVPQSLAELSPSTVAAVPAPSSASVWTVTSQTASTLSAAGGMGLHPWAWWCALLALAAALAGTAWYMHRRALATETLADALAAELAQTRRLLEGLFPQAPARPDPPSASRDGQDTSPPSAV